MQNLSYNSAENNILNTRLGCSRFYKYSETFRQYLSPRTYHPLQSLMKLDLSLSKAENLAVVS